jgi:hypothetical protein
MWYVIWKNSHPTLRYVIYLLICNFSSPD